MSCLESRLLIIGLGHNMQILAIGMGPKWDGNIVRSSNPMRRDVQLMPPALSDTIPSHLVIQWAADNPGGE